MLSSSHPSWAGALRRRRVLALLAVSVVALVSAVVAAVPARAADGHRIELRVLVVTNGQPSEQAIATQLDREGVPYTLVDTRSGGRPVLDGDFLADEATGTARFQAVVLPNHDGGGLASEEMAALGSYQRRYGVRQVSAYNYPGAGTGMTSPAYAGSLDGGTATVTAAAGADGFGHLRGPVPIDDFAPGLEVYGYLAAPAPQPPAGESFTPLLTATAGGESGVLAGVLERDGREELVLTAAYNSSMEWFSHVGHGIVNWMTRGVHLGHQRNYFAVHIDDVFLADSRWSVAGNCTPGDDCVDPAVRTKDIRMTEADVARLRSWQDAHDFRLDMVFNAGGIRAFEEETGRTDAMAAALLAAEAEFPWINHTWSHPFLGCIQIAPTAQGQSWRCATAADETPRQDPEVPGAPDGGTFWAAPDFLRSQIADSVTWARGRGLTDFDAAELVTGEHSGLTVSPQQPRDNPFLGDVLTELGVRFTASDASREPGPRPVGAATTVPRHPMNIYYNTATYREQIDEYNWYYTTRADGGGGICEDDPRSTCISPLPAGDAQAAKASFEDYLAPLEVRNALSRVLANDPRPFYAHQANLAEDGLLYPVVEGVLSRYRAGHDDSAPLVRTDLTGQYRALQRMTAWRGASGDVRAYLDATGVHVPDTAVEVPLTVPAGTAVTGADLESYGGQLSGWTGGAVTAVPPTRMAGYTGTDAGSGTATPAAPVAGTATAGDASVMVGWSAPADDGGSPVTGYVVSVFEGDAATPVSTLPAPAGSTELRVPGLTNGTPYTFTVAARNAVGLGPDSGRTAAVTPAGVPGAPVLGTVTAGDGLATLTWSPPADTGGAPVTGYVVSVFEGAGADPVRTVPVDATATGAQVTGLTNGTGYGFAVAATTAAGTGASSERSAIVVPASAVTAPGAPAIGTATAGAASATVTWSAPEDTGGAPVTGYVISVFGGTGAEPVRTEQVAGTLTAAEVTGLQDGTAYSFTVTAVNDRGPGPASARSNEVTPVADTAPPGAPGVTSVTAGPGSAVLAWSPPVADGGSPVTGYEVSVFEGASTSALRTVPVPAEETGTTVAGLVNGTSYTFTVAARSAAGVGAASARTDAVTPLDLPGAPAEVSALPGTRSVTASWQAPADTGGAPLTGYVVRATADGAAPVSVTVPASATSATVTGLVNGTAYTVSVAAVNAVGTGAESAAPAGVTPAGSPGTPRIGTATAGAGSATVTWSAPTNDGGSPLTGYTVSVLDSATSAVLRLVEVEEPVTSTVVTGLDNGTSYRFKVAARNAAATGSTSSASNRVVPRSLPGAPTIGAVDLAGSTATVRWTPPADTGGSALTGYTVYVLAGEDPTPVRTVKVADGSAVQATVTSLPAGTTYRFAVAARNASGTGAASEPSPAVGSVALPGAPVIGTATAGDGRATVTWTAPAGSTVTGYVITVIDARNGTVLRTVDVEGAVTSATVPDLTNGARYRFKVAARNEAGVGKTSAASNRIVPSA